MEGQALAWFQYMTSNAQFTSWPAFLQALQTRFVPSQYDDLTSMLFKLTQTSTVADYLFEFENLANRIIGLPPPFLLACFISGSRPTLGGRCKLISPSRWSRPPASHASRRRRFPHAVRPHVHPHNICFRPLRAPLPCLHFCRHLLDRLHLRYDGSPRTRSPPAASAACASLVTRSTTEGIDAPLGFSS